MNPAHKVLKSIGLSHICGVWISQKKKAGPTKAKDDTVKKYPYSAALRNWITSKQKAALKCTNKF
jgi:hypothetical protein